MNLANALTPRSAKALVGLSVTVAITVIVSVVALGLDARFAHMSGYAAGLVLFFLSPPLRRYLTARHFAAIVFAIVALAYTASLLGFSALQGRMNAYAAQAVAAAVFVGVCWSLCKAVTRLSVLYAANVKQLDGLRMMSRPATALFVAGLTVAALYSLVAFAGSIESLAELKVSNRIDSWINTAECFAKTGKILAVCSDTGAVMPVENASLADDRGHGLLLSAAYRLFGASIDKRTITVINFVVSVFGISLLAWQLARNGLAVTGIILFLSGIVMAHAYLPGPDAPSTYFGLFALALVMPIQLLRMLPMDRVSAGDWAWFGVSILLLSFVAVMRQPFGMMAIVVAASAIAYRWFIHPRRRSFERALIVIAAVGSFYVANNATQILVSARSIMQGIPQGSGKLTHGIAHNLYLGLGAEPNSFGVKYDDDDGIASAKKVDPAIAYGSREYYDTLLNLYFDTVRAHPMEVARIYAVKVSKAFGAFVLPMTLILLALNVVAASLPQPRTHSPVAALEVTGVICLMIVLNTMQGVLTVPTGNNFPSLVGFAALAAMTVDMARRATTK